MSLSKEKVEELLQGFEKIQAQNIKEKNVEAIAAAYHPDALIVQKGLDKVFYGREGVKEGAIEFLKNEDKEEDTSQSPIKPLYSSASTDGNYLIRRGEYRFAGKYYPFEQIYKKTDGKYLVYHEEFEFST